MAGGKRQRAAESENRRPLQDAMLDRHRPVTMQRPGGRSETIRQSVASSVLKLLGAGNLEFTIGDVAELSGVGRRTIHRRWPNRIALLREALAEHNSAMQLEFSGDFEKDLYRLAVELRNLMADPREAALQTVMVTSSNREFRQEVANEFENRVTKGILERFRTAQKEGDIADDVDIRLMWNMLGSTIFMMCFVVQRPPDAAWLRTLVAAVLRMCGSKAKAIRPRRTTRRRS